MNGVVRAADFILHNEAAIKTAVDEARAEMRSYLPALRLDGGRSGSGISDRTAMAALSDVSDVSSVILSDGREVRSPESWLRVLDEVRGLARECAQPDIIFAVWDVDFIGRRRLVPSGIGIITWARCKEFIRYHVLVKAREAGLGSFSDDQIFEAVEEAYKESSCTFEKTGDGRRAKKRGRPRKSA